MMMKATTGQELLTTEIQYFGKRCLAVCDQKCHKAWGINGGRPEIRDPNDEDNVVWFADDEVGEAPANPGTYEGGQGKPTSPPVRHNKWCVRQCERSDTIAIGKVITCPDWSHRVYNYDSSPEGKRNVKLTTGTVFK
jgi:hypothetical protein